MCFVRRVHTHSGERGFENFDGQKQIVTPQNFYLPVFIHYEIQHNINVLMKSFLYCCSLFIQRR